MSALFHRRASSSSAGSVTGRPSRRQRTVHPNRSLAAAVRAHCALFVAAVRSEICVQWCAGSLQSCARVLCAARVGQSHVHCAAGGTVAGWVAAAGGGRLGTAATHRQILCPFCVQCVSSESAVPSPRSLPLCPLFPFSFPFFPLRFHFLSGFDFSAAFVRLRVSSPVLGL